MTADSPVSNQHGERGTIPVLAPAGKKKGQFDVGRRFSPKQKQMRPVDSSGLLQTGSSQKTAPSSGTM